MINAKEALPQGGEPLPFEHYYRGPLDCWHDYPIDTPALETSVQRLLAHRRNSSWQPSDPDLALVDDKATFDSWSPEKQNRLRWLFGHRYDAEAEVARQMWPFVAYAPTESLAQLMYTQLQDEKKHVDSVVRIYQELFGIEGGELAVQLEAARYRSPASLSFYGILDRGLRELEADPNPDTYLSAITAYHILAEGTVAVTLQELGEPRFREFGNLPGLLAGQKRTAKDEKRHVGTGTIYGKHAIKLDRPRAQNAIDYAIGVFTDTLTQELSNIESNGQLAQEISDGYGTGPFEFAAAMQANLAKCLGKMGYK